MMMQFSDLFTESVKPLYKGVQCRSQYLTMRDGTPIAIDVMLPAGLERGTRIPVVMIMARYWRSMELRVPDQPNKAWIGPREPIADYLIPRGFGMVVVDGRGTGASGGVSRHPWTPEELADYGEVAAWAAAQAWCNGNIGAVGISYEGSTAQYLLASGVRGVKSAAPMEYEFDVYTDVALPGGIFNQAFINQWNASNKRLDNNQMSSLFPWSARLFVKGVRPVDADRKTRMLLKQAISEHQANTDVYEAMRHITYRDDAFGSTGATLDDFSVFRHRQAIEASGGAMLVWGSWLDATTADTVIRSFNTLSNPQIGIIGTWKHEMTAHGSPYQKPKGKPSPLQEQQWATVARFFEQTLKGKPSPPSSRPSDLEGDSFGAAHSTPPPNPLPVHREGEQIWHDLEQQEKVLFYYTLGAEEWKQTDQFPLPNTDMQTWYFQAGHGLAPEIPRDEGVDRYTVDFEATTGLTNRWHTQMARPLVYPDRAKADQRLLVYTSAPAEQDMEITGYPVVTLYVSSTETDGAFLVYLEDVDEKGVVRYITEGQLRGIHRKLSDESAPYWTGMPYRTFKRADVCPLPRGEMVELTFGLQPTSVLIRRGHRIRVAIAGADKDTFARIPERGTPTLEIARHRQMASHIRLPVVR